MDQQRTRKTITSILLISLVLIMTNTPAVWAAGTYKFTATISPSEVNVNQLATYSVTITNTGDNPLGSTSIAIPEGFTVLSPITIQSPPSMWNYTNSTTTISLSATVRSAAIPTGASVEFTFDATAPSASRITTWIAEATSSLDGGGVKFTLEGEQPRVTVISLYVAPTILASHSKINQGQISLLSQDKGASEGTPPYTYQWLEAYDGGTFSPIPGANGLEYNFSPTTSTATGTWSFKLDVTDSSIIPVTVTSNTVNVIVNSELTCPEVTATPNDISQTQISTLTSSPVTTGTSPYIYQWFQKAPGSSYTTVGSDAASYTFPGTTTIGTWSFILQVTDDTGASVSSTAVDITVSSTPTFTITVTQTAYGTINPGTIAVTIGGSRSFSITPNEGYHIADVLADGISVGALTSYTFADVIADHNITANFEISADYCFINVASSHGSLTPSAQVTTGASFTASVTSPEGDTTHRWICTGYNIDGGVPTSGTSYTFTNVQANHTITFNWQEQYHLTAISQDGSTTGTGWYNTGTTATVSVPTNTITSDNGIRKIFTGWTGDATGTDTTSNPITIDSSKTATATWKTQYQVTYTTSGNILQMTVPPIEWVDPGALTAGTFATSITNSAGNTKSIFVSDNRPTAVTEPITVTGIYHTQYLVTLIQNGMASDASGIVVTILGETKTYEQLPNNIWINAGNSITFSYAATVETTETGKQYILASTNFSSPLTINEPTTIQGFYEPQMNSSNFTLTTIALLAILLSVPPSLAIPLLVKRTKSKKKIVPIASQGGSISPGTMQTIERGGDSTIFIITAHLGYRVEDVMIDKAIHLGPVRTYKFFNVTKNHTISATFCKN